MIKIMINYNYDPYLLELIHHCACSNIHQYLEIISLKKGVKWKI